MTRKRSTRRGSGAPPDKGPKEKPSTTHPKRPPHQISSLPVRRPRDGSHEQPPSTNPVQRTPAVDSHPEPQPTCALAPKNAHLKPSRHRTGTTTVTHPTPSTTATRAPRNGPGLPVTGPSPGAGHPSIPPPFHWLEEKCPKTSSQEPWIFLEEVVVI